MTEQNSHAKPIEDQPRPPRRRRWLAWAALLSVAAAAAYLVWRGEPARQRPDPRLTFQTPYRNVRPNVQYVGDAACVECHADIAETYRQHPMANSLAPISAATKVEQFDAAHGNPFQADGFTYQVEKRDGRVVHAETLRDLAGRDVCRAEEEIDFAIGSGSHARSYLFQRGDTTFYSPITWYTREQTWGLSPAFVGKNSHLTLAAERGCLFCHGNRMEVDHRALNRYRLIGHSIGCERCHGPGELHVRRQEQGQTYTGQDFTIVNPAKLDLELRESVCQQCHLEGVQRVERRGRLEQEFRPGLPWREFMAVFVKPAHDAAGFVGHYEQMRVSRCYVGSEGRLGCVSCHDPHLRPEPEQRVAFYRQRCQACHEKHPCSEPREVRLQQSPEDDCVQCHMPTRQASDIEHVAISDHRVPKTPEEFKPAKHSLKPEQAPTRLEDFHAAPRRGEPEEAARDLGIALVRHANGAGGAALTEILGKALPMLAAAVRRDPDDTVAWEAYAKALWRNGDTPAASDAVQRALALQPERESALALAGGIAIAGAKFEQAVDLWRRANKVNPWHARYHQGWADAHFGLNQYREAAEQYRRSIELDPTPLAPHEKLAECYRRLGQSNEALLEEELARQIRTNTAPRR